MFSLLRPALLAGSIFASGVFCAPTSATDPVEVRGQIKVHYQNKELGCVTEDFSWQVGVDCPTFVAEVTEFQSERKEFTLKTDSGLVCGTNSKFVSTCGADVKSTWYWTQSMGDLTDGAAVETYQGNWFGNGVPGSCQMTVLGGRKVALDKQVKVQLIWQLETSSDKHRVATPVKADATCATPSAVAATPTAVRIPPPKPTGGAFGKSATGHLVVLSNGRKAGCIDANAKWNKDSSKCATFSTIWQGQGFELYRNSKYCYFLEDGSDFFCMERAEGNYFYGKGSMLVNPTSPKTAPVGSPTDNSWSTTFYAHAAPAGSPVELFDTQQEIEVQIQWVTV